MWERPSKFFFPVKFILKRLHRKHITRPIMATLESIDEHRARLLIRGNKT